MRNSFVFYKDWANVIKDLPAEIRLDVYDAVIEYAISGKLSDLKPMAKIAFGFIKQTIDRDTENYSKISQIRSKAGKIGANKKWQMIANDSKNSKCHDNDNDNDIKTTYPNDSELSNNNSINRDADNTTPPERGRVDKSTKLNNSARIVFETHFLETFGSEYYWTAKDAGNMRKLIEKLKFQREKKGLENDDDNVLYALKVFLESIRDGWIFENFSVPNINSKFNEIISNAKKNGTNRRNSKAPYSPEELRAIVSAGIGLAKAAKDG